MVEKLDEIVSVLNKTFDKIEFQPPRAKTTNKTPANGCQGGTGVSLSEQIKLQQGP